MPMSGVPRLSAMSQLAWSVCPLQCLSVMPERVSPRSTVTLIMGQE